MVLVFVLIWVKSVLRCLLYIFHLSGFKLSLKPITLTVHQKGFFAVSSNREAALVGNSGFQFSRMNLIFQK